MEVDSLQFTRMVWRLACERLVLRRQLVDPRESRGELRGHLLVLEARAGGGQLEQLVGELGDALVDLDVELAISSFSRP